MRRSGFIVAIDSWLLRKGMVSLLNRIPGTTIIREFDAGDPLMRYLEHHNVDFLIISQPVFNGTTRLFLSRPGLLEKTILLKTKETPGNEQASINPDESKEALTEKIMKFMELHGAGKKDARVTVLTHRERTIIRLVSMGYTNRQIADQLFLSTHTVTTHRKNISSKLGIKSVSGLTVYSIVNNIITIDEVTSKPSQ